MTRPPRAMARPPRRVLIALITGMTAISSASVAQYLPSLPAVAAEFATTPAMVQLTLSFFMVSYALAQLVWGPLSDRYGRRSMLLLSVGLYIAASFACATATSIEGLIAFRVVQAAAAAGPPVIARAIVRDLFELREAARVMAYVIASFSVAPVLGPVVGAALEELFGWRSNFMFMVTFAAIIAAMVFFVLPETLRRGGRRASLHPVALVESYASLLASRVFMGYALTISFAFCCIFVFNSVAPFLFIEAEGLTPIRFALAYGTVTIGFGGSSYLASRLTPKLGIERTILMGTAIAILGAAGLAAAVLAGVRVGVAGVCAGLIVVGLGSGFIFPNAQAGAIAPYPEKAGAASGMSGFLQMAFAAVAGIAAIHAYDGTPRTLAFAVLLLIGAALASYWALILRRPGGAA